MGRGCPTLGCGGDPRYAAPGRGHVPGCTHPDHNYEKGYTMPDDYHGPSCGCDDCLGRTTEWVDNGDGTVSNRTVKKEER